MFILYLNDLQAKITIFLYLYDFPTCMISIVSVGEKGQIVIPKRFRDDLHIQKGTKLILSEDKGRIIIKPAELNEDQALLLLSEASLKKVWDNKFDERWDDVL